MRTIRAFAFEPGVPPPDLQLWEPGGNSTDYGVHLWTERSMREVLATYTRRGNPLPIDIEHNCSEPERAKAPDAIPVTGGYAYLEVRAGAPWLRFDWSGPAVDQIASRQRLFLSAEYDVDRKTGEIVGIKRVSLVSNPGTHHARQLAWCAPPSGHVLETDTVRAFAGGPMDLAVVLAALRAALAAEDPAVCKESISNLLAELSKSAGGPSEPAAADAAPGGPPAPPGDKPAEDKPMAAGAPPAPPAEKKDEPVAASAPVTASAPAIVVPVVTGPSTKDAIDRVDALERSLLLRDKGDRLEAPIRAWAATQPLAIVKGLLEAAPEKATTGTVRASATRGERQGETRPVAASAPEVLAELDERMGLASPRQPIRIEGTRLVLGVMTAEQAHQHIAAKAKEVGR